MPFQLKRIYDPVEESDGFRVLVDRLWPRGIKKENAKIDLWLKEISPSNELRKWVHADPARWDEFRARYFAELESQQESVDLLLKKAKAGKVTLLFSAKNEQQNNAVALKEYLEKLL